jgi:hypothetical protein
MIDQDQAPCEKETDRYYHFYIKTNPAGLNLQDLDICTAYTFRIPELLYNNDTKHSRMY